MGWPEALRDIVIGLLGLGALLTCTDFWENISQAFKLKKACELAALLKEKTQDIPEEKPAKKESK